MTTENDNRQNGARPLHLSWRSAFRIAAANLVIGFGLSVLGGTVFLASLSDLADGDMSLDIPLLLPLIALGGVVTIAVAAFVLLILFGSDD